MLATFVLVELRVRAPMVEFRLFASRNFIGANMIALIVTFAMLAQFFFIALYMQNILGYSPARGRRPVPAGDPDDRRRSPRSPAGSPTASGRAARSPSASRWSSVAMFLLTRIHPSTTYGDLFPSFILMGLGMALVMSPMSTAAMNAVADAKAGIASGILSMNRMVGGTLGVAVIGAVFQGVARSKVDQLLAGSGLTAAQRGDIAQGSAAGSRACPRASTTPRRSRSPRPLATPSSAPSPPR